MLLTWGKVYWRVVVGRDMFSASCQVVAFQSDYCDLYRAERMTRITHYAYVYMNYRLRIVRSPCQRPISELGDLLAQTYCGSAGVSPKYYFSVRYSEDYVKGWVSGGIGLFRWVQGHKACETWYYLTTNTDAINKSSSSLYLGEHTRLPRFGLASDSSKIKAERPATGRHDLRTVIWRKVLRHKVQNPEGIDHSTVPNTCVPYLQV